MKNDRALVMCGGPIQELANIITAFSLLIGAFHAAAAGGLRFSTDEI